ncbi:MAG: ferrous iron transport protein B [Sphingomonadales bacterium]|nr:ferrous iron transport protein B [Sphingomonadales bacterium]
MVETIALIGNPNCGKSTLFNRLTGLRQKISNLPGTTVEKKLGLWQGNNHRYSLLDLPGIYSLYSESEDEKVVVKALLGMESGDSPNKILFILDASNLRRNLLLFSQVSELKIPMAVLLTMNDTALRKNLTVSTEKLESTLGVPIVKINPRKGEGIGEIHSAIANARVSVLQMIGNTGERLFAFVTGSKKEGIAAETLSRYAHIEKIVAECVQSNQASGKSWRAKLDYWLTHRILGYLIFGIIMLTIFQGVFTLAEYPMNWIEQGFGMLSEWTNAALPAGTLTSLISDGLIPGIAGVVVFVPQIAILFLFIGLLEDSGYMTRASFITDRVMRRIGLNGRSVIPLISGFACAIPSIMATRSIKHKGERLATMFVTPLMSCSARLPVYTLLISLAIPETEGLGPFSLRSVIMTLAYFAGIIAAIGISLFFKKRNQKSEASEFILEMPTYQLPRLQTVLLQMSHKSMSFVTSAGKVIVIISMILWALSSYGPGDAIKMAETDVYRTTSKLPDSLYIEENRKIDLAEARLEASYAGHLGKFIEPAIQPLGYDWKTGIAIISSFAAREVFVGTMATLFRGREDNPETIRDVMKQTTNPETGKPLYGLPYALSLMIFYAYAMQCMSTIAVMKRETGGWKWPFIQFASFLALAWLSAWVVFNLTSVLL